MRNKKNKPIQRNNTVNLHQTFNRLLKHLNMLYPKSSLVKDEIISGNQKNNKQKTKHLDILCNNQPANDVNENYKPKANTYVKSENQSGILFHQQGNWGYY